MIKKFIQKVLSSILFYIELIYRKIVKKIQKIFVKRVPQLSGSVLDKAPLKNLVDKLEENYFQVMEELLIQQEALALQIQKAVDRFNSDYGIIMANIVWPKPGDNVAKVIFMSEEQILRTVIEKVKKERIIRQ